MADTSATDGTDTPPLLVDDPLPKVRRLTLNRPEKRNAMNDGLRSALFDELRRADRDRDISVIVIRGNGPAFCAGYDISPSGSRDQIHRTISQDREQLRRMVQYWLNLWGYRKPIIGQVQGHCLAGGLELIAICDIVIASEDAQFGHPAGRALGIPPTLGFWPVLIGLKKTKELCIRKVLGANVIQVLVLIPKSLLILVLISGLITIPITYFMAVEWLSDYAFRIAINPWMFIIPLSLVIIIAALSVLPESIKVALLNPSKYLRNE